MPAFLIRSGRLDAAPLYVSLCCLLLMLFGPIMLIPAVSTLHPDIQVGWKQFLQLLPLNSFLLWSIAACILVTYFSQLKWPLCYNRVIKVPQNWYWLKCERCPTLLSVAMLGLNVWAETHGSEQAGGFVVQTFRSYLPHKSPVSL